VRQCCKNSVEYVWFNFRYALLELFLDEDETVKFILFVDESNLRGDSINPTLDKICVEMFLSISDIWKYNVVYKKVLHFFYFDHMYYFLKLWLL